MSEVPIITKVAVLGSGVMGSQIAGFLAGLGLDVFLLDIVPPKGPSAEEEQAGLTSADPRFRNTLSRAALERLGKMKPPPLFRPGDAARVRIGNFADDLERLTDRDWIIEVVVERLDIKRDLYARLEKVVTPTTIVTSNTSGLSVRALLEGRSLPFRRRFLVTHFFNPPRYLKLMEIVPGPDTDPAIVTAMAAFAERQLGKGAVFAKDTPDFIANRIGVFHLLDVVYLTVERGWPIEAVDAVLGPPTAHPKSGVFRTGDVVGLDTLTFVAETVIKGCADDPQVRRFAIPQCVQQMIARGWLGEKAGQGFYKKDPVTKAISAIDLTTLDYRPAIKFRTPSLGDARSLEDPGERLRRVVFADDQAGEIAWPVISHVITYAAARIPEIADDIVQVDRAMRWGYNMELGPFEMCDALGVSSVAARLEKEGAEIPPLMRDLLQSGKKSFYEWQKDRRQYFDYAKRTYCFAPGSEHTISLKRLKETGHEITGNAGASLIDLGDGVFCCEFHTKMNAIDSDVIEMLGTALDRTQQEGVGLLIANQGEHFSAGANLLLILMAAQQGSWQELDDIIRRFQEVMQRIRFSLQPVLAVPFGMAIGGGCEVALSAGRRQLAAETYIGLVEVGAGVIPAGGGCKNMLLHFDEIIRGLHHPQDKIWSAAEDGGPFPKVAKAFQLIGAARVSISAFEAGDLGLLTRADRISLDKDRLLSDAKAHLLEWEKVYTPPAMRHDIWLPGRGGKMALLNALREWRNVGKATEYDEVVAEKLAHVLAGGDQPTAYVASEQHLLDLEREAFLSLCGNHKTHERMASLLQTGKPLRN